MRASTAMTPSGRAITVEVQLGDLRQVIGQARHPEQGVAQRADVSRRLAAVTEQRGRRADRVDQVVGIGDCERGQPGHAVA
jgi:hypothetical protein